MSSTPKQSVLNTSSPEELSSIEILEQIRIKSTKDFWEVLLQEIWRNLEKLVSVCLTSSHRCIPNTIQRKALETLTSKMESCWLHHSICRIEKTMNPLSNANRNGETCCIVTGGRSNCKKVLTLSWGKPWCLVHLGNRVHWWNLLHCFHLDMKNREINSRILFSETLTRKNVGRSLLEGNKDHLLSQAKSELMREAHHVDSLNNCISELQQHACAQRLELQDAQHGYSEPRREQVRLEEELSMKEEVLRDTQIRNVHEMGEMKRGQELRVDKVSAQKL